MENFISGSIGGLVGVFISHPIDTVKTRIQIGSAANIKTALKMKNFYSGIRAPLLGIPLEKSIVFGFYNLSQNYGLNNFWSGIVGGFMSTLSVTPVEYFKINSQNKNSIDLKSVKLSTIYRGFLPTVFRETPGFGIYFTSYNYLNDNYNKDNSYIKTFCYGGISGLLAWMFIYPSDLVKTIKQDKNNKLKINEIISKIYKDNGLRGVYKGFHFAAARAIPLHAGVFLGYELSKGATKDFFM
jgi:solute carrier family 25 carnitine/acylcarnitine transporter 20/29